MLHRALSPSHLLSTWDRLSVLPMGSWIFSKALGFFIPYSGSLGAKVLQYQPGYALVELKERRRIRNHLGSIHAAALMNLAELASGLALHSKLPRGMRGIVTTFEVRYLKKARGAICAESIFKDAIPLNESSQQISATIRDADGAIVVEATATWLVRPPPSSS